MTLMSIIHINCNTIDTQETDRANNCSTNTAIYQGSRQEQHYTDMMQEADRAEEMICKHRQHFKDSTIKISQ